MVKGYDEKYNMDKEQGRSDDKNMEEEEERQKMDSEKGRLFLHLYQPPNTQPPTIVT